MVPVSIVVRQATSGDLDTLWRIERECFSAEAFSKGYIAYLLETSAGVSLVAQVDREIVGSIMSLVYEAGENRVGHVCTVNVLAKHRRKGVASRLLGELERIFMERGVTACFLEVRMDNVAARELYRRLGYKELERLRDYYGRGVHGIRLRKSL